MSGDDEIQTDKEIRKIRKRNYGVETGTPVEYGEPLVLVE
jgi:hypothetical protein